MSGNVFIVQAPQKNIKMSKHKHSLKRLKLVRLEVGSSYFEAPEDSLNFDLGKREVITDAQAFQKYIFKVLQNFF